MENFYSEDGEFNEGDSTDECNTKLPQDTINDASGEYSTQDNCNGGYYTQSCTYNKQFPGGDGATIYWLLKKIILFLDISETKKVEQGIQTF